MQILCPGIFRSERKINELINKREKNLNLKEKQVIFKGRPALLKRKPGRLLRRRAIQSVSKLLWTSGVVCREREGRANADFQTVDTKIENVNQTSLWRTRSWEHSRDCSDGLHSLITTRKSTDSQELIPPSSTAV